MQGNCYEVSDITFPPSGSGVSIPYSHAYKSTGVILTSFHDTTIYNQNYDYPWHEKYSVYPSSDSPLPHAYYDHAGQDYVLTEGAPIYAIEGGIVNPTYVGEAGYVSIYNQTTDRSTGYMHMKNIQVFPGQNVLRGQKIGEQSNVLAGYPNMASHLHLERFKGSVRYKLPEFIMDPFLFNINGPDCQINPPEPPIPPKKLKVPIELILSPWG